MNFWRIEKLKKELANQTVSQKDLFVYYLISGIGLAFLINPAGIDFYDDYQGVNFKWIEWILTNLIYLLGLFFCYEVNGGRGGRSFIDRVLSIEIVLIIRYLIFLLLPLEIVWLLFFDGSSFSDFALLIKEITFEFVVLLRTIQCMGDIIRMEYSEVRNENNST